jgi:hypothetical protein
MTSSPSLTSNNFIVTHHLNTLHNNVGNYFEFICMKTSLTMFDNSDTFENFFLFRCYKLSSVNHQQTFSFMVNNNNFIMIIKNFFIHGQQQLHPSPIKNFFIHDHQQQLHDHQQTFSFMVNNNNFIMIIKNFFIHGQQQLHPSPIKNFFIHDHQQQLHPSKTFSFMIINNNFINHHQQTFSFMIINNNFIHHPSKNFFHS